MNLSSLSCKNKNYNFSDTIFYRINASPQIDVPPPKFLDHVPEVSRPDLPVNSVQ